MVVLVTGASGFIGLNVTEYLLREGGEVVAASNSPLPDRARAAFAALPGTLHEVDLDVRDESAVRRLVADTEPKSVVIGAAVTPAQGREAEAVVPLAAINVLGAVRTLEACLDVGVERSVYLSSASVYGSAGSVDGFLREVGSVPAPTGAYGHAKLAAEQLILRLAAARNASVATLRIGTAFGPWERETGVRDTLSPIYQVMALATVGSPVFLPREGRRDYVYARDVAAAVVALLASPGCNGTFNLGLGHEWSVADWCKALAKRRRLEWRIAQPADVPNVDLFSPSDRPPLAIKRLTNELRFTPVFGLEAALEDYLIFLDGRNWR